LRRTIFRFVFLPFVFLLNNVYFCKKNEKGNAL